MSGDVLLLWLPALYIEVVDGFTSSPMSSMGSIVELVALQLEHLTTDSTSPQNRRKGYSSPDLFASAILAPLDDGGGEDVSVFTFISESLA